MLEKGLVLKLQIEFIFVFKYVDSYLDSCWFRTIWFSKFFLALLRFWLISTTLSFYKHLTTNSSSIRQRKYWSHFFHKNNLCKRRTFSFIPLILHIFLFFSEVLWADHRDKTALQTILPFYFLITHLKEIVHWLGIIWKLLLGFSA